MPIAQNAQLIVVAGPDDGRRFELNGGSFTLGRSATCQIALSEEYISREHARLSLGNDGIVLEVLSSNGLSIGGRKYKRGKEIVLAAGDVIELGADTKMLFIDRGGDAQAALANWQAEHRDQQIQAIKESAKVQAHGAAAKQASPRIRGLKVWP